MSRPWMPLYVGDYLADTSHLSTLEHGAYMLLIMHYWRNGGVPECDDKLARIARLSLEQWQAIRTTIQDLFYDGWKHKRVDIEIATAEEKHETRVNAGKKGGEAKASNAKAKLGNAVAKPYQSQSQSQPEKKDVVARKRAPSIKTLLPENWRPSDDRLPPDEEREFEKMRDWARAGAIKRADWAAQWRNWLRNTGNFQPRQQHGSAPSNGLKRALERLADDNEFGGGEEAGATVVRLLPHR